MLDGKKVKVSSGSEFDPVPMDRYTCQITDVNLIKNFNKFQSAEEDNLKYTLTILDDKPMATKDGKQTTTRGRLLWHRCRIVINDRSWLGKLAAAVVGRNLTKDEIEAFDPEGIVGKQVDVVVTQDPSKDGARVYNNISAFGKTAKQLEPVQDEQRNPVVYVSESKPVSVPKTAPAGEEEDPEKFVEQLEEEGKTEKAKKQKVKPQPAEPDIEEEEDEESPEVLEAKLKLAKAKAKAAKAKKSE